MSLVMTWWRTEIRTCHLPDDERMRYVLSHGHGLLSYYLNLFLTDCLSSFFRSSYCLTFHLTVPLTDCLSDCLFDCPSDCLSDFFSDCISYLIVYLTVCLIVYLIGLAFINLKYLFGYLYIYVKLKHFIKVSKDFALKRF